MNEIVTIEDEQHAVVPPSMIRELIGSEIDVQIATAHRFPRSLTDFRKEMLMMTTLTVEVAEECVYSLKRAGKVIEGPSARFAEIVASAWGNNRAGARVIHEGKEFVTAQGVFHDLQRNMAISYEVQRRITDSKGKRYSTDMIGVTANAACSIAIRNAILKGVPKAFWNEAYMAARRTIVGDERTFSARVAAALEAFGAMGVDAGRVYAALGVRGDNDVTPDHLVHLRGTLTAIREGDTTIAESFPVNVPSAPPAPNDGGNAPAAPAAPAADKPKPASRKKEAKPETPAEEKQPEIPLQEQAAETAGEDDDEYLVWLSELMPKAETQDELDELLEKAKERLAGDYLAEATNIHAEHSERISRAAEAQAGKAVEAPPAPDAAAEEAIANILDGLATVKSAPMLDRMVPEIEQSIASLPDEAQQRVRFAIDSARSRIAREAAKNA